MRFPACIILTLLAVLSVLSVQKALAHGTPAEPPGWPERHISFPDTDEYRTLVVDLHTHSVFSDGHVWPFIRVEEALRDGLDAVAITEHLEWQPHLADLPHPDRNRAFSEAEAAAKGHELLVIPGVEITREPPAGHINAVFISDANALLQPAEPPDAADPVAFYLAAGAWPAAAAVQAANDQGAFLFWNHPQWTRQQRTGIATMSNFHRQNARKGLLHGIEIANGQSYSEEAFELALKHDLAVIGTSDVHDLIDWDYPPHLGEHRPVTLVLAEAATADAIREALFARRSLVWFRQLLLGHREVLAPLVMAALAVTDVHYREASDVLAFTITNNSDAEFMLMNQSDITFMETGDLITLPARGSVTLGAKPGGRVSELALKLQVSNALTAPARPLRITLPVLP